LARHASRDVDSHIEPVKVALDDHLLVCGVAPVSEFLDDFVKSNQSRAVHG
jgi:hypothetical protein